MISDNSFNMENSDHGAQHTCFQKWMSLQEQQLSELLQALNLSNDDSQDHTPELSELIEKNIKHFQEYGTQRVTLARNYISPYFSPAWCSSLERSMLWAGGCRPAIFIRLLYALCGHEILSLVDQDYSASTRLARLSARQMSSINSLQQKTIRLENNLSTRLASLQEEIADDPIAILVKKMAGPGESSREAEEALHAHDMSMTSVLEEADNLRLNTLKELMEILTPIEAVDFLASGKKLQLCLHAWGKAKDSEHGRG